MVFIYIGISLAVSLIACTVYFRILRTRMRDELKTDAILGRFRSEVSGLITEMNATTERNVALLESRIGQLSELLEKSSKTASVLRSETEAIEKAGKTYASLARSRPISLTLDEPEHELHEDAEKAESDIVNSIDFDSLSVKDKTLVLHRRGETSDAIAANLGMSRGEVELIISLHDRRR